jgi:DNA replication protein DnaC
MEAQDLYDVMIERYGKASTVMTSSRYVDAWMGLFDDPLLANSLLDRLTHNAHHIIIEGESYRKRMGLKKNRPERI